MANLYCDVLLDVTSSVSNKLLCWQLATTETTRLKHCCSVLMQTDDIIKRITDKY